MPFKFKPRLTLMLLLAAVKVVRLSKAPVGAPMVPVLVRFPALNVPVTCASPLTTNSYFPANTGVGLTWPLMTTRTPSGAPEVPKVPIPLVTFNALPVAVEFVSVKIEVPAELPENTSPAVFDMSVVKEPVLGVTAPIGVPLIAPPVIWKFEPLSALAPWLTTLLNVVIPLCVVGALMTREFVVAPIVVVAAPDVLMFAVPVILLVVADIFAVNPEIVVVVFPATLPILTALLGFKPSAPILIVAP